MMSKSRWGLNWKLFSPKEKEKKKNFTKVDFLETLSAFVSTARKILQYNFLYSDICG